MVSRILAMYCIMLSSLSYGQKYDKVNIYAIPIETSFAGDHANANYIRVNHKYTFSSTDQIYIQEINEYFLKNVKELPSYTFEETTSTIRIVIDFIQNEEITSFVLINAAQEIYISDWKTLKRGYYQLLGDEICTINKIIPFFYLLTVQNCE